MTEETDNLHKTGGEPENDALTFVCGQKTYALPVKSVERLVTLRAQDIYPFPIGCDRLEGLFSLGGQIIPIARVPGMACRNAMRTQRPFVVARARQGLFAFAVDALNGIDDAAKGAIAVQADDMADRLCTDAEAET